MITSAANPKIKYVRRLQSERRFRERERVFVVEGERWLRDLLARQITPQFVCHTTAWADAPLLAQLGAPAFAVTPALMAEMSDVETAPGVLAVVAAEPLPLPPQPTLLLILDAIQTPGNLGTMLRTAAAAGADGVLLAPGSVDAYNPKVLRGAMGAHLRLPLLAADWATIAALTADMQVLIAEAGGALTYSAVDWRRPSALVIGNEGSGPGADARALGRTVSIPMAAATESLNAAMAAGIILFEAARQRAGDHQTG